MARQELKITRVGSGSLVVTATLGNESLSVAIDGPEFFDIAREVDGIGNLTGDADYCVELDGASGWSGDTNSVRVGVSELIVKDNGSRISVDVSADMLLDMFRDVSRNTSATWSAHK